MKPTPMMQQYLDIKERYPDSILFFRLGDFYEMFNDDAILAAKELEITLTRRDKKNPIPMCGVPHHSAQGYIERLIEKGYKVALCEQLEDPKSVKGMVKRDVVRVITPGTVMSGALNEAENNYIMALQLTDEAILSYCDISTGALYTTVCTHETLMSELASIQPREIIVSDPLNSDLETKIRSVTHVITLHEDKSTLLPAQATEVDTVYQPVISLLFDYLHETQKQDLTHIENAVVYSPIDFMRLDMYAKRNLELTESIRLKTKKGTLLSIYNETKTPMGHRLLKEWIERPRINANEIEARLQHVALLNDHFLTRDAVRNALDDVYDIERLVGRVSFGNVNAKDFIQLKYSLQQLPSLNQELSSIGMREIPTEHAAQVIQLLESINEDAPLSIKDGDVFKSGFNVQLDEYREANQNGKVWLSELQNKERVKTGIKSLKVAYNKVFGYYIEISKANLHNFDADQHGYYRKQTLTNAERFITDELKAKEEIILGAEEKAMQLEYDLFIALREEIKTYIHPLKTIAKQIAYLDVIQNFSEVAMKNRYTRPVFSEERTLELIEARHPVVETVMNKNDYVPNDCSLNDDTFIYLITGPNMSGKSTYMRQVALISIMAQMGSYVPCEQATLPIFDQIFTRIGAADDLVSGQSTFMVEMLEAKNALTEATVNSLIIFDEIGRGTSTYDGLSLAQSMIEYVHHHIHAKTLFSTHYHELVRLEDELHGLKNIHVAAKEEHGQLTFLHKVMPGAVENSYGIHVAKLAELPTEVIDRAAEILNQFEQNERFDVPKMSEEKKVIQEQFNLFGSNIEEKLLELNIANMTPIEALLKLKELQDELK